MQSRLRSQCLIGLLLSSVLSSACGQEYLEGQVVLLGGGNKHSGTVHVFKDDRLWSVCDDAWSMNSAKVVCTSLGFSRALQSHTNSFFGTSQHDIGLDNVQCYGDETSIWQCRHDDLGRHNCNVNELAGVTCSQTIVSSRITTTSTTTTTKTILGVKDPYSNYPYNSLFEEVKRLKEELAALNKHQPQAYEVRLMEGRRDNEGRVEVMVEGEWGVVCGDNWGLLEAMVVCRQVGLNYSKSVVRSDFFGGANYTKMYAQIRCDGDETSLHECYHGMLGEDVICSRESKIAGVICTDKLPDLVPNATLIQQTVYIHDQPMFFLQCAMEEKCAAASAFDIKKSKHDWHIYVRRLLRFSSSIWNFGTADFRPELRKQDWEWHLCHMHYHSMQVFARYDLLDLHNNRVAEGHKASFCLEDVQCLKNESRKFACKGFGEQGISVGCADDYLHDIDCQWIDITDVKPGNYVLKIHINPNYKIAELDFSNNAVTCVFEYNGVEAHARNCRVGRG